MATGDMFLKLARESFGREQAGIQGSLNALIDPIRSALVPAKIGAPIMPAFPPTISTRPKVPLFPSAARAGSGGTGAWGQSAGDAGPCGARPRAGCTLSA